jgi:hypothetical protein
MAIPFVSGLGFTEVSSSGNLNDKAGTTKSKLPIQFFRLTDNIAGNLTMTNDSAHKKIILDTNGNNIINDSGSPITNNSSATLELKGSGNVQSTVKTFTSSVSTTSNTGTTTISEADNSTVVVTSVTRDADISLSDGVSLTSGFGGSFSTSDTVYLPNSELISLPANPGTNTGLPSSSANAAASALFTILGGGAMPNAQSGVGFSITVSAGGVTTTFTGPSETQGVSGQVDYGLKYILSNGNGVFFHRRTGSHIRLQTIFDPSTSGKSAPTVSNIKIPNNTVSGGGRTIAFTNNLAISVVLSGADPFDDVTVAAGATNTQTIATTDGSFNVTGTISGSDGSSRPFALKDINDGTGSVNEDSYTGTKSVSAF